MSIFNDVSNDRAPLQVGETKDDRIGCYLFGIEMPDGSEPSYHSLAISRDQLVSDCLEFFTALAKLKKERVDNSPLPLSQRHARDLKVIVNAMENISMFIDMHLKQGGDRAFLDLPGMRIFLTTGERPRQKIRGMYIE